MSRDIRSFFAPKRIIGEHTSVKEKVASRSKQKKRLILSDSDSDDGSTKHPEVTISKKKTLSLNKEKEKINDESTLKPINVSEVFGNDHIKRSAEKTIPTANKQADNKVAVNVKNKSSGNEESLESELNVPWDEFDEIESKYWGANKQRATNAESCDSSRKFGEKGHDQVSRKKKATAESEVLPSKRKKVATDEHDTEINSASSLSSPIRSKAHCLSDNAESSSIEKVQAEKTPNVKKVRGSSDENADSSKKHKMGTPTGISKDDTISDQGALSAEKKKEHALNYIRYLNREGPKHHGSKVIPEGSPHCLEGLVFVITGVLDSLDREEATGLINKYGGRVTSSLSRNTSYLLVGDDAGLSKLEKAKSLNTKQLDEDGLLNLIVELSAVNDFNSSSNKETPRPSKITGKKSDGNSANLNTKALHCTSPSVVSMPKTKHNEGTVHTIPSSQASTKKCIEISSGSNGHLVSNNSTPSLWVEKYRPTSSKQIIGQQGEKSVLKKLSKWLENWYKNRSGGKNFKPSPWAKDDDGSFYKAALISGPPGIGKTTAAHLVSKEQGFDVVEFNASDTRSKKLLHDEVTELLSSKSLYGLFHGKDACTALSTKHVLIMDEVDGMAGNEDRGGIQELIQLIKSTHIPIICICNDRNHPKIRSLVNYCFDLRVQKPRLEQIRGAMMSVCFKEGLKIPPDALTDVITCANQDIRQVLNNLSMWYVNTKNLSSEEIKTEAQKSKKEFKLGPWDVLRKVFSAEEHKTMSIHDKSDLFFYDYNISPLFVQENYLNVVPSAAAGNVGKMLELISATADSISYGDTIEKAIRSRGSWSLLPMQAMFSSVFPGDYMQGYIKSQINFPSWLGKNSRANKFDRLSQELHVHMRLAISGSKLDLALDYLPYIRDAIVKPLISEGTAGVHTALDVLKKYYLLREDLESLLELSSWPEQKDPMSLVDSKVKAALTRAYNKEGIMIPYAVHTTVKKKTGAIFSEKEAADSETVDDVEEKDEDSDDIKLDAMIKVSKKKITVAESTSGISEVKKGKGKGRGKTKQHK